MRNAEAALRHARIKPENDQTIGPGMERASHPREQSLAFGLAKEALVRGFLAAHSMRTDDVQCVA